MLKLCFLQSSNSSTDVPSLSKDLSGQYCRVLIFFKFSVKMVNKRRLSLDALPDFSVEERKFKRTKTQIKSSFPFKTTQSNCPKT